MKPPPPDSLQNLHTENPQDSNPWRDSAPPPPPPSQPLHIHIPSPNALEEDVVSGGIKSRNEDHTPEINAHVHADVLDSFDPLAYHEEQNARDAWANAEGHPPPPQPQPPPPPPKPQDPPPPPPPAARESAAASSSSSSSTFPSFSSFARSFALPSLPNMNISLVAGTRAARPQSIDTAVLMQSPVHPSATFASQQLDAEVEARGSPKMEMDPATSLPLPPPLAYDVAVANALRRENSSRERAAQGKDRDPPFDFQKFLDQMKTKSAEPVARYLRSFLSNFAKRTFTVSDQIKLINDFLNFISQRMREADVWKSASDVEFDNAIEGMEKLVMNRLYDFTFTPQIARSTPPRPITTDDLERDRVLTQRIALFGWVEPAHLDIPTADGTNGFLLFAQQELVKINHYKAPRDKLICILNCCKVIFGLIRHLNSEESADTFVPILIYVVLKASPENLLSNVEFINRFRSPTKLQSEAGYYLSSLMGAVSFIETMDHTSLSNITQEEFEKNVENAIQMLSASRSLSPPLPSSSSSSGSSSPSHSPNLVTPSRPPAHPIPVPSPISQHPSMHAGEEPATPLSLPSIDARRFLQRTGDSISKPLSAIGRIFSDALDGAEEALTAQFTPPQTPANPPMRTVPPEFAVQQTPYKPWVRRASPSPSPSSAPPPQSHHTILDDTPTHRPLTQTQALAIAQNGYPASRTGTPTAGLDIQGLQAEIDAAHLRAADAARGTLIQIFPAVDREVIEWVLEANEGDLGRSIEALLEISGGGD